MSCPENESLNGVIYRFPPGFKAGKMLWIEILGTRRGLGNPKHSIGSVSRGNVAFPDFIHVPPLGHLAHFFTIGYPQEGQAGVFAGNPVLSGRSKTDLKHLSQR